MRVKSSSHKDRHKMKLKSLMIVLALISSSFGRVLETKISKLTNKSPIVLRQDVEEYSDSENAVDGNISESNTVDETDASEIVNCYEVNCNEASNANADEEANSENNEVLQEINQVPQEAVSEAPVVNVDDANPINRYCKCTTYECNCCRDFLLPLVPVKGPGCATIQYLDGNRMSIGIKFGDRVLANRVISGRKATPVCMPLPGGFNRFCGRIYGISRRADDFFKACLGLELRADNEIEAVLRVSCFKFGPRGLSVTEPEPLPPVEDIDVEEDDDEEDDDEADDLLGSFGLGDDDDDDEDDDDDDEVAEQDESEIQSSDPSYTGFSLLEEDLLGDLLGTTNQKKRNTSLHKKGVNNASRKNVQEKKPTKEYKAGVPEVHNKNVTVSKIKHKDEDNSDEISAFVESIVSEGDDESTENDDDNNEDDERKQSKRVTEETFVTPAEENEEDEYDESEEDNETINEGLDIDSKESKKPKYGFSWTNFTRLFRIL
ncbi:uncharacterized protein LOC131678068 isoform X2 [Topomyia yanbarensis]|uniref:uncharacterized protein LOC131678068 isoform X2 n=1 Tax=Topomyia yanbarensis TaxID=2498891 RepID=UPI00273C6D60|nr:uncharacterized protein LOC131678068 isoform X2 [Topomyia yanbarensis]